MPTCEVCGNTYDKTFEVRLSGTLHIFDSFECAIHALAPSCAHCGCRVIGHGVELNGEVFCCSSCSKNSTIARDASDNAEPLDSTADA
jgi:hypothetical protein